MTTQDISPYAQGKLVGENWTPGEPPPVSPFPPATQESVDFQAGLLNSVFPRLEEALATEKNAAKNAAERRRLDAQTNVTWEDG